MHKKRRQTDPKHARYRAAKGCRTGVRQLDLLPQRWQMLTERQENLGEGGGHHMALGGPG